MTALQFLLAQDFGGFFIFPVDMVDNLYNFDSTILLYPFILWAASFAKYVVY